MLRVPRTCLKIQEKKNEWDREKRRKKGRGGMYERAKTRTWYTCPFQSLLKTATASTGQAGEGPTGWSKCAERRHR